ncbi:MAG: DNA repair exonuclease, partial [Planctomycetes bacterium]|nr:DNA repair exonuclease [Planctomycetota bacterium]
MSNWPFRFIHAGNFHLEQPIYGVAEVPDHLRETFLEAHFRAALRVFDAALAEEVDFVVLSGDLVQSQRVAPRSLVFLARQFERLAERNVAVYWAGGAVDPPHAWPAAIALPDNVHVFPVGRAADFLHQRDEKPLARLVGRSREEGEPIASYQLRADVGGLFTIAVVSGTADEAELTDSHINYWALGGRANRSTLCTSPVVAHWPGSPQGRSPQETGPHGATLVQVDEGGR